MYPRGFLALRGSVSVLRENGLLIDANDLWIAATALAVGMPVVTRHEKHFARVPELNVMGSR